LLPPGSTGTLVKAVFGEIFKEEGDLKDTVDLYVKSCITSNAGGWAEGTNSVSCAMIKEDKRVEIREVNPTIIQTNDRLPKENGGIQQHKHGCDSIKTLLPCNKAMAHCQR
jgi:hypothetical protein